jgi:hypothetical protein
MPSFADASTTLCINSPLRWKEAKKISRQEGKTRWAFRSARPKHMGTLWATYIQSSNRVTFAYWGLSLSELMLTTDYAAEVRNVDMSH